jgi:cytochrome c
MAYRSYLCSIVRQRKGKICHGIKGDGRMLREKQLQEKHVRSSLPGPSMFSAGVGCLRLSKSLPPGKIKKNESNDHSSLH